LNAATAEIEKQNSKFALFRSYSRVKDLLTKIDKCAKSYGLARSRFMALIAKHAVSKNGASPLEPQSTPDPEPIKPLDLTEAVYDFLLLAIPAGPLCLVIAVANSLLLVAYARDLKRRVAWGNVTVSYLSASVYPFGGALAGATALVHTLPLAGLTFLAMLSRELLRRRGYPR
jgi:hypothetical protein